MRFSSVNPLTRIVRPERGRLLVEALCVGGVRVDGRGLLLGLADIVFIVLPTYPPRPAATLLEGGAPFFAMPLRASVAGVLFILSHYLPCLSMYHTLPRFQDIVNGRHGTKMTRF